MPDIAFFLTVSFKSTNHANGETEPEVFFIWDNQEDAADICQLLKQKYSGINIRNWGVPEFACISGREIPRLKRVALKEKLQLYEVITQSWDPTAFDFEVTAEHLAVAECYYAAWQYAELLEEDRQTFNAVGGNVDCPNEESGTSNPSVSHSPDFTSVNWFGTKYSFKKGQQSRAIKVLWEAFESGGHSLSQEEIQDKVGSAAHKFRLSKVFKEHPAWGTMIKTVSKGVFQLSPPQTG